MCDVEYIVNLLREDNKAELPKISIKQIGDPNRYLILIYTIETIRQLP